VSDERSEFEPRLGRLRESGGRPMGLTRELRARRAGKRGAGGPKGRSAPSSPGLRRVIVKARIVRLAGTGLALQRAHLGYIQREGAGRGGERGRLYDAETDPADGEAFLDRGREDRHHFRFIVSPEDRLEDLRPLVRDLMAEAERDLGTKLDWVAVDHHDTEHPHAHVLVRGRRENGRDLVMPRDYVSNGLRRRASEALTRQLGRETTPERAARLERAVDAERLTALDGRLFARAEDGRVALAGHGPDDDLLRRRLAYLERLKLARRDGPDWRLDADVKAKLAQMGERTDARERLARAVREAGLERAVDADALYDPERGRAVTGRVVKTGLADELTDRGYLVLDCVDGRVRHVDLGEGGDPDLRAGQIVTVAPVSTEPRAVDRTIAAVAAREGGVYSPEAHARVDQTASWRHIQTHVRRLEALRRAGVVERRADGSWPIAPDHLDRVRTYEPARAARAPVRVAILSALSLEAQTRAPGATWLDEALAGEGERPPEAGLGREVNTALAARRAMLVERGFLDDDLPSRRLGVAALAHLRRRTLDDAGRALAPTLGKDHVAVEERGRVDGTFTRTLLTANGKLAVIERAHDFSLVPWREDLERVRGRMISARLLSGGGIDWTLGRTRGLWP
jgi:type IV secretory pathway VirD2 relaxase